MSDEELFEGWAVLELMGHRRLAGYVTETTLAGAGVLRLDLEDEDGTAATQFYGGGAVYCLTPCTEEAARAVAARSFVKPPAMLGLPQPQFVPTMPTPQEDIRCDICSHTYDTHDDGAVVELVGGEVARDGPCRVAGCECMGFERDIPF